VQGQTFGSLRALSEEIGRRRIAHDLDKVFADPFLSEVVTTMHPDVLARGYHAACFRETSWRYQTEAERRARGGFTVFKAWFVEINRWQACTTYPWRRASADAQVTEALREKFRRFVRPLPSIAEACSQCGAGEGLEYDHVAPTFDEIAHRCLRLMTPEERTSRFGWDKFSPAGVPLADHIPDDHPAMVTFFAMHRGNRWQWLCPACRRGKSAGQTRERNA
jgi:hypothetical protein